MFKLPISSYVLSVLCVAVTIVTLGQSVGAAGTCGHTYTGTVCKDFVNYSYYLPANYSSAMLEGAVQQKADKLTKTYDFCRKQALAFACASAFQPCHSPYPIPRPACRSLCVNTTKLCAGGQLTAGEPLTNCTAINPATNQSAYPEQSITVFVNGVGNVNVPCNPMSHVTVTPRNPCEEYEGTLCKGFLPSTARFLVPPGYTQESLEQGVKDLQRKMAVAGKECRAAATRYACSLAFRPCTQVPVAVPVSNPPSVWPIVFQRPPCKSVCTGLADKCGSLFKLAKETLPDCDAVDPISHGPEFPTNQANYSNIMIECNSFAGEDFSMPISCPKGLVATMPSEDIPCSLPCPLPVMTTSEFDSLIVLASVCGWLSFIGSFFVLISHLVFSHKRQYPQSMFIHMAFSSVMFSLAPVMSSVTDPKTFWCKNQYQPSTLADGACGFQAFLIQFFAMQTACWWVCIVYNMYATMVQSRRDMEKMLKWFALFSWVVPTVLTVAAFGTGKVGYHNGSLWCWINNEEHGWYQYGLFYIELMSLVLVGSYFAIRVAMHIQEITSKMQQYDSTGKKRKQSSATSGQIRTLVFVVWILMTLTFVFAYRVNEATNEDTYTDALRDYVVCLVSSSNCSIKQTPSFALALLHTIFFTCVGIALFTIMGTTRDIRQSWRKVILRKWDVLQGLPPREFNSGYSNMSSARTTDRSRESSTSSAASQ